HGSRLEAQRHGQPVRRLEVVEGPGDGLPGDEPVEVLDEVGRVERARLVPGDGADAVEVQGAGAEVVDVLRQHQHVAGRRVGHRRRDRRRAAARAARDAYHVGSRTGTTHRHASVAASLAACLTAASRKPVNGGEGRMSRDLNSGWLCTPRKNGWPTSSTASTRPSPRPSMPGVTPETTRPASLRRSTYSGFTS